MPNFESCEKNLKPTATRHAPTTQCTRPRLAPAQTHRHNHRQQLAGPARALDPLTSQTQQHAAAHLRPPLAPSFLPSSNHARTHTDTPGTRRRGERGTALSRGCLFFIPFGGGSPPLERHTGRARMHGCVPYLLGGCLLSYSNIQPSFPPFLALFFHTVTAVATNNNKQEGGSRISLFFFSYCCCYLLLLPVHVPPCFDFSFHDHHHSLHPLSCALRLLDHLESSLLSDPLGTRTRTTAAVPTVREGGREGGRGKKREHAAG